MQHVVRDGQRQLTFDGTLLASSSSQRAGNPRWVEFELYRTSGGQYVLSRIGWSTCYHLPRCAVVSRNRIEPRSIEELGPEATACEQCRPSYDTAEVYPEQPRYWAQSSETPDGVINSLYKWDDHGTRYLTHVAKRLLHDAAVNDRGIERIYLNEHVA